MKENILSIAGRYIADWIDTDILTKYGKAIKLMSENKIFSLYQTLQTRNDMFLYVLFLFLS